MCLKRSVVLVFSCSDFNSLQSVSVISYSVSAGDSWALKPQKTITQCVYACVCVRTRYLPYSADESFSNHLWQWQSEIIAHLDELRTACTSSDLVRGVAHFEWHAFEVRQFILSTLLCYLPAIFCLHSWNWLKEAHLTPPKRRSAAWKAYLISWLRSQHSLDTNI